MATASAPTKKISLPLQIFYGAMERQVPLADYAKSMNLGPDILHQALTGRLHGADSQSVSVLAQAINRDPAEIDWATAPFDESFGIWLKRNMEGVTQHALRARAQLDYQTLKRFLNGDLLPDSDQAERISRALYIDRIEVARVVTANMAAASPSTTSDERASLPAPATQEASPDDRSARGAAASPGEQAPQPQRMPRRKTRSPRQPDPAITPDLKTEVDVRSSIQNGRQPAVELDSTSQSAASPAVDRAASRAPATAKRIAKAAGTRRPKQSASHDPASVAAAEAPSNTAADERPVDTSAAEEKRPKPPASRRRPTTIGATATDQSTSGAAAASLAAEVAPPTPDQRSTDTSADRTAPLVAAELAADTTTLQLSVDEVRLVRHWRLLHPHGRRATLQYIGSLLVDD